MGFHPCRHFASSYTNKTNAGAAADLAVQSKQIKYSNLKTKGFILVMLSVEIIRVWCEEGRECIGLNLSVKTGNRKSRNDLTERISMVVQRGNAASIVASLKKAT